MLCWSKNLVPIKSCLLVCLFPQDSAFPGAVKGLLAQQSKPRIHLPFQKPLCRNGLYPPLSTPHLRISPESRGDDIYPGLTDSRPSMPRWSRQSLQGEQTESTGASASLSPQLVPVEAWQKAPIAETPNSLSQTFTPLLPLFRFICYVKQKFRK